jgi:hypothetical protein
MTEPKPPDSDPDETPESIEDEPTPEPEDDEDLDDEDLDDDDDSFDEAGYLGAMSALKGRSKEPAPNLGGAVEEKIRKRSGGRFFGDRSLTDRMSIGVIALVILAIGVGVFYLLKGSETGSLKLKKGEEAPQLAPGAREAMPKP